MSAVEILCGVPGCNNPPLSGSPLCHDHQDVFDRDVPEHLEKRDLSGDELAVVKARVAADAAPLFLAAVSFAINDSLRKGLS